MTSPTVRKIPINKSVKTWRTSPLSGHCTKRRVCMATSKSSPSPFHFLETAFLSTARFCVAAFFLLILSATGASAQNNPATGVPTISGTLIEGRELTADTSGISDADGPDPLPFTYQWNRNDGTTDTAISGADSATYTLTQDDVGEMITVTVRYTDANNTNESLTSAPTSAITANMPPTANAGSNQRWDKGTEVTLDGTGSDDPDGDNAALTYLWERTAGPTEVTLSDTTAAQPTFTIPNTIPTGPASYTFRLIVSDGQASSAAATVRIFIRPLFLDTIANQTFSEGNAITPITLPEAREGPNSLPSTNTYTLAPLPAGLAFDPASRTLSGAPSNLGTFNLTYTATNEFTDTDSLSFSIEVTTNTPPTTTGLTATTAEDTPYTFAAGNFNFDDAESGDSLQQVRIATLPASTSGSLALNGTLVTVPQEIAVADIPNLVYTPALNVNGAATFTFSVSDGTAFSTTATATITVTAVNDPPIIAQGLTVPGLGLTGGPRTFDLSSLFSDIDGDALTYTVSISNGSVAFVTVIAGSVLNIAPRNEGTTTITITADDGNGGTAEQVVTVTVVEALPTAVITSNYDSLVRLESGFEGVDGGVTITFDGSASFDPSGAPLTYRWEMINSDNTGVDLVGTEAIFEFTTPPRMVGRVQMFQFTLVVTNTVTNFSSPGFPHGLPPIVNVTVLPTGANNDPTGSPTITGSLSQGQTLTASRGDIQDPDGLVNVVFSYQWNRHDAGMDTPISGATGSSYRLTPDDVDELITVTASYRDNQRTDESVTSAPVGPVAAPALPPSAVITSNYDSLVRLNNGSRGVDGGVTIRFDGSGSSDPGGGSLIYSWRLLDTETGGFTELGTEATFEYTTPSRMTESQDFLIYLVVTNTANLSSPGLADSETISVFPDSSNAPPSGLPTVSGNATLGATLTVNTSGISDADGPANLSFTYQWNTRVGSTDTPISGATGNSYQLTPDEVGELITVTALYTDNQITDESVTSDPVGPVALAGTGANTPPTSSGLSATINEDTSYTFATGDFTFNDADGDSLQRVRIDTLPGSGSLALNNVAVILGQEIAATAIPNLVYTPGANVNGTDSFTYSVSDGTDFSATFATATIAINAVNDDPTGEVTISGILAEGQTLTANTDSISDADGPASLSFTYQWFAGTSQISGANMRTYTPTQGNVGQMISVDVSYMDANGIEGGFFSGPVGPVLAANAPPVAVVTSDYDSLVSTTLNFSGVDGGVTITFDGSGSFDPSGAPLTYRWETLNSASTGVVVVGTEAIFEYTTPPRMVGRVQVFQFALVVTNTVSNVSSPNFLSGNAPITSVSVWPDGNNDPTGSPTITGNPTQGRILTASPGDIQDTNGLTNVVFSYQWNRHDAGTDTPISGATGDSYRLTPADVGEEITVTASYRDNQQTDESVTSAPVGPVAAPSLPPSAVVTSNYDSLVRRDSGEEGVDGGVTIRFDGSASSDPGGGSLTYSWRLLNTETGGFTELGTEATFEYTTPTRMAQAQNFLIQLIVTNSAGISSPELANPEVVRVLSDSGNTPPTGLPTISGNAAVGATLTADTDGISDADGPDPLSFTYQWFANDGTTNEAISGATSATYILTPDEMGDQITVTVSYTDAGSTDETLTSAPTIAVAASSTSNTPPTSSGLTVSTEEDTAHSFAAAEFTFADADGDALHSLRIDTLPATGSLTLDGAAVIAGDVIPAAGIGTLVYTPAANATGDVSFTFSLSDDSDGTTFGATATATVTIDAVNDAPTTSGLTVSTQEDTAHSFTAGEFNFADADGDDLDSLRIDTLPATGSLTLDGTAVTAGDVIAAAGISNLVYTPAENATGDDTFTFSLSDGTAFGATATATVTVTPVNDAPSGLPIISGTTTQGETLTANTSGISDADGPDPLSFTYQWNRNDGTTDTAISGATSATYTLTQGDVGEMITLTVSYTDGGSTDESLTSAPTAAVTAASTPNNPPTGLPIISGTATEGETLTANTSGISDADGPDPLSFTYQWNRNDGTTDTAISGATSATYTLTQSQVGQMITVTVSYTDAGGEDEGPLTSAPTAAVANVNDEPTGLPIISGTATEGETLTANTSGISDADGPDPLSFTYQWNRNDGTTDTAISGATSATYTLTQSQVGQMITVTVSYTDAGGEDEGPLTSAPTAAVANVNDEPTGLPIISGTATEGETLTANTSGISDADGPDPLSFTYQWNRNDGTTDTAISGATSATYTLTQSQVGQMITVTVSYTDAGGEDEGPLTSAPTAAVANVNDEPTGLPIISGTATEGETLTANTSGISDADGPDPLSFTYQWNRNDGTTDTAISGATSATYTLTQSQVGQMITVTVSYTDAGGEDEGPLTSAPTAAVTAASTPNNPPTGLPIISGTATEGETLTANTSGISDADGPDPLSFTYQWNRNDGTTDTAISGATSASYILTQGDVGEMITLTVSYTDGGSTDESLTSAPTAPVANVNDPTTGLPVITGDHIQGETLTADTSAIMDEDGLGTFTYRWLRNGQLPPVSTERTYTLTQADVGAIMFLDVFHTDAQGTIQQTSLFSSFPRITNINDLPTGLAISGGLLVGQTLRADTSALVDIDGLPAESEFSYQWRADGADIANATEPEYLLTAANIGAQISLNLQYRDAFEADESITSPARGPVRGAGDNAAPTSGGLTVTTDEDTDYTFAVADFPFDDGDDDDSLQAVRIDSLPTPASLGALTLNGAALSAGQVIASGAIANLVFTPALNASGAATFTYSVSDGVVFSTPSATATVTVTPVNDAPSGTVTIDGTPIQGQTLTANTIGISDADGPDPLPFTYQWNTHSSGADTAISGETSASYTLSASDVGNQISVSVRYTDAGGNAEGPLTSAPTAAVAAASTSNNPPSTSALTVMTLEDTAYTFAVANFPFSDTDSSDTLQAVRIDTLPDSADGSLALSGTAVTATQVIAVGDIGTLVYTPVTNVNGDATFTFSVSDGTDFSTAPGTATVSVTQVNDPATGRPSITPNTNLTTFSRLFAIDFVSDVDGKPSSVNYQWNRHEAGTDTPIDGATSSSVGGTSSPYAPTLDDVGARITVTVSFTDNDGNAERVTSLPTEPVAAGGNALPTGILTIDGDLIQGQTLTLNTADLGDLNGLPDRSTFTYRWAARAGSMGDFTIISGATSATYTLTQAEVGKSIFANVSYRDDDGNDENRNTVNRGPIANINDSPSGSVTIGGTPVAGQPLSADTTSLVDIDGLPDPSMFTYRWLAGSNPISNATLSTYTLTDAEIGQMIRVEVSYTDNFNASESITSAPTAAVVAANTSNTPPTGTPVISGTTTEGEPLTVDTSGISDADGLNNVVFSYQWNRHAAGTDTAISSATSATYLLAGGDVGEMITVTVSFTDNQNNPESLTSAPTAAVAAASTSNTPPTGTPVISGTTTEGEPLTVDTSGISDADGLNNVIFSYQWNRHAAGTDTAISSATSATYLLAGGDVGEMITVTVSFTDNQNNPESLTSAPTAAVAAASTTNTPPTTSGLTVTLDEDDSHTFAAAQFNFDDADSGDTLQQVRIDTLPASTSGSLALGGVAVTAGQEIAATAIPTLVYTPALNANGAATFTFSVSDGTDFSTAPATATLTVTPVNDPPTISDLTVTLAENTPHTFAASQFNFADTDGDALHSLRIDTLPTAGSLTLNGATVTAMDVIPVANIPTLVYTPATDTTGDVTFTYSLSDGTAFSASTATATLTITDVEARITDLNEEVLPEVARVVANLSVEGITHRIDQVRSGTGRSVTLAGQNSLAAAVSAHGQAMADGTLGMKDVLGNSAFVLPLNATDGASGSGSSLTFWGGGNYREFEGSGEGVDFDGDLFSAQLGVDGKPHDDLLIGLAASWSKSDINYRGGAPNLRGEYQLEVTSLHPYVGWEALTGLDLWVTAGYGQGDLEITNNRQNPVSSDVETWTLGTGGNYQLPGTTTFWLKGSALLTELEVKGGNGIAAMEVDASLLRIVLEKSHKYLLSNGAYMEPSLEAGARYDSGGRRRETGLGAELGAGLRYANPAIGLTLEGKARTLVGRDDYEEWGVSGRILLQPGSNGRGLLFSLSPVYGSTDSGTQALWQEGLRAGKNRVARDNSMRMESRLGYGLGAPGGHGLLTPYAEITSGESIQRYRLGMNWEVGSLFDLNLVGERSESTDTDHAILLEGVIRY